MKRAVGILAGVIMAAALAACTPTSREEEHDHRSEPPAGAMQESTVDGVAEKQKEVVDAEPAVTVCIYSVNGDGTGLKQNMDAIDGETLDAQLLLDKMAELGVVEDGIEVLSFADEDGVLTLDLSSLEEVSDELVLTAVSNTFIQNYEATELNLSVAGEAVSEAPLTFERNYKTMK